MRLHRIHHWVYYHVVTVVCTHHDTLLHCYEYVQNLLVIQTQFELPIKIINYAFVEC